MRAALQYLWREIGVRSILDVPCGDFAWMKEMDLNGIGYTGGDLVEKMIHENKIRYASDEIHFEILDLTTSPLPKADLVICRDCLVHLSFQNIHKAVANIKASGSTWLLCTSFIKNKFNYNIKDGNWRTLNMERAPFHFPKPVKTIEEYCPFGEGVFSDKALCLWKLEDI